MPRADYLVELDGREFAGGEVAEGEERRLAEVNVEVEGGDDEVGWPDKEHHTVQQQQK